MKLSAKFLFLLGIPTLLELLLLGILVHTQIQSADAERWAVHSKRVISQAYALLPPILMQAADIRTAVITQDPAAIASAKSWQEIYSNLDLLRLLVADSAQQVRRVDELRKIAADYALWSDQVRGLIAQRKNDLLIEMFRHPDPKNGLEEFRSHLSEFLEAEKQVDDIRTSDLQQAQQRQQRILIAAIFGSLLAAGLAVYIFSRMIGSRLSTLTLNAQRMADRVPLAARTGGNDEISLLDSVLHQSAVRLAESERAASVYRNELELRAVELGIVNENLRQQTQDNEMFIYSVSHDLRSPLVNLQGFSNEIMHACSDLQKTIEYSALSDADRRRLNQIIDADLAESLRFLQTAVARTSNIIDALLRLSRAGQVEYRPEKIDANAIVERVVSAMHGTIVECGVEVIVQPLASCWADPTAIEQIFGNLISNAVAYLDKSRPGRIEVDNAEQSFDDNRMIVYRVKDNGLGIPAISLPKLFAAFQRFHGSIAKGEGIGLALVRRAVERHGGRIWVESTQGVGTTFFFSLPVDDAGGKAM